MCRSQIIYFLVAALFCGQSYANKPPLERAKKAFELAHCNDVIEILGPLSKSASLQDEAAYVDMYRMLGFCYAKKQQIKKAEIELENLFFLRPNFEFDPFATPPPILKVVHQVKKKLDEKRKEIEDVKKQLAQDQASSKCEPCVPKIIEKEIIFRRMSLVDVFVPFGYPQFKQDANLKGILIAASEVASIALNVGFYWWKRSVENSPNTYNTAQGLQIGAIGLGLAVYAYGVIDALVNYRPIIEEHVTKRPL